MLLRYRTTTALTNRQTEELAKFSLDISKLSLGSLAIGLFSSGLTLSKLLLSLWGVVIAMLFFTLGMRLFKEVT